MTTLPIGNRSQGLFFVSPLTRGPLLIDPIR